MIATVTNAPTMVQTASNNPRPLFIFPSIEATSRKQIGPQTVRVDIGVDSGCRTGDQANVNRHGFAIERHFAVARDAREARLDRRRQFGHVLEK